MQDKFINYIKVLILGSDEKENLSILNSLTQSVMIETEKVKVSCYRDYALWLVKDKSYYGGADKVIILGRWNTNEREKPKLSSISIQEKVRKILGYKVSIYHVYGNEEQKLSLIQKILG
nr:hypothetical protein Clen_234 [Cedratvirus lena]